MLVNNLQQTPVDRQGGTMAKKKEKSKRLTAEENHVPPSRVEKGGSEAMTELSIKHYDALRDFHSAMSSFVDLLGSSNDQVPHSFGDLYFLLAPHWDRFHRVMEEIQGENLDRHSEGEEEEEGEP